MSHWKEPLSFEETRNSCENASSWVRSNSGESIYHSLQTSLEKRLSSGFSAGVHYTYSSFIDTMSETLPVSWLASRSTSTSRLVREVIELSVTGPTFASTFTS